VFRTYLVSAFLALGLYGYAQYKGWSVFGSQAEEFRRYRAEQAAGRSSGGGFRGGSSGHK